MVKYYEEKVRRFYWSLLCAKTPHNYGNPSSYPGKKIKQFLLGFLCGKENGTFRVNLFLLIYPQKNIQSHKTGHIIFSGQLISKKRSPDSGSPSPSKINK